MTEIYDLGVDMDSMPGRAVITTITLGQRIVEPERVGDVPVPPPLNPLRANAPGYLQLALAIQGMLGTPEGGEGLGPNNKVAAWDLAQPYILKLVQLVQAGHLPRCENGQHLVEGAFNEILYQHSEAWEPDWIGQFASLPSYIENGGTILNTGANLICIDAKGRRCFQPGDFIRASTDGAFPVRYFYSFKPKPVTRLPPG